ncbi:disulfide bond formation protein B [Endozoicomonas sp. SCSIO W0465]|uniref:disulfide bond formation protein B n=1 Tax=Endozoicomonas sp. SCSIO W0465 TaxID=2918516 RepID=UPI0020753E3B|nr:disulfide bond formation protein B [Endozoicomonas sp. SCSIO W0465]USE38462.1 disulfide bond formation protein B [Endozoicomonas sp. SCSIO W0465]
MTDKQNSKSLFQHLQDSPLQTIHGWQNLRVTWLIMFATALFLELCALGFQYLLHMDPCERCVYQRLAVLALMLAPLVIIIAPTRLVFRISGYSLWMVGALYGLKEAIAQTADYAEFNPFTSSCSFRPVFPFDLPLYEWWPSMFMPTGICGADDWTFLILNMAEWMVMIFSIYLLAAATCIISSLYCTIARK